MQQSIVIVDPHVRREAWLESYVSFRAFTKFLQQRIAADTGIRVGYYRYVLDRILEHPDLQGDVPVTEMHRYQEVLELVATLLFPVLHDENESLWALGNALTPEVFFGSNAFYNLLTPGSSVFVGDSFITPAESQRLQKELLYQMILQQLYHYPVDYTLEWVHGFVNPATGLYQYYRINISKHFTELRCKVPLPDLPIDEVKSFFAEADALKRLQERLPMQHFVASGFSVFTLTDVTAAEAVEQLGKLMVTMQKDKSQNLSEEIGILLRTIVGSRQYAFGMLPVFTINGRAGLLYENYPFSVIVRVCQEQQLDKVHFNHFIRSFLLQPERVVYTPGSPSTVFSPAIREALTASGIRYYVMEPVYADDRLVGVFEVSSQEAAGMPADSLRTRLQPVLPFVTRFLQLANDKVNAAIDGIINDKFTSLQPAVQWKFREVAWHYFRNNVVEKKRVATESISFENVYPLYGAIDIRDSTIERNKALRKDLLFQLNLLRRIFIVLEKHADNAEPTFLQTCEEWLHKLATYISIEQELVLADFLELEVMAYLDKQLPVLLVHVPDLWREYQAAIVADHGTAFTERRKLESAIQQINFVTGQYFDLFKVELQTIYPCYFEKQRTDGVEYDIYIGQSIAPRQPFETNYLQRIRLMQLQSMAALARLTHSLLPQMQHPLYTTQLLFVHSRTIDISFRTDEQRFDVEGAYNIRYHIIKKRIDKVRIQGSHERLTQVGKIALVYYNGRDAAEYQVYIAQLQKAGVLLDDLELLELEELQGVSGLKAMRVGVNLLADS